MRASPVFASASTATVDLVSLGKQDRAGATSAARANLGLDLHRMNPLLALFKQRREWDADRSRDQRGLWT